MLNLRSLHHFLSLSRRLNYARAAEDLGLSQSALSRSIQALERQLGMRLFDRDRGGVVLTPQGRLAAKRAEILLADAEDFERELHQSASAEAGHIRFGMAPMPARPILSSVIAERLRLAPNATHEVIVRDEDALRDLLIAGDIEFFITNEALQFDAPRPRIETLGHFPVGGIVRAGHPLLSDPLGDATFPVVRSSWKGLPLPPEISRRMCAAPNVIEDFALIADMVARSDAIWFSSAYAVADELAAGTLKELPLDEGSEALSVRVVLYSLERRSQSPAAVSIKALVRARIRQLVDQYERMARG